MKGVRNLEGTFMYCNEPIFTFKFERGDLIEFELIYTKDQDLLPYDFILNGINFHSVVDAIEDLVTPSYRHRIEEDLREAGIPYYSIDKILRYNNGISPSYPFWVKFKDGPQTYKEAFLRRGWTEDWIDKKIAILESRETPSKENKQ